MPSAVAFLPEYMIEFVNLATSVSLNFGSGMIFRLGTSRRRGILFLCVLTLQNGRESLGGASHALGRLTPYFERLRLRFALLVELGPDAPDASSVPRTTW